MWTDYGIFLGKSLKENSFEYPDPLAGFAISRELFNNLLIENSEFKFLQLQQLTHFSTYFFAGAIYQLASFLENDDRFCTQYAKECAIYPKDVSCKTSQEKAERWNSKIQRIEMLRVKKVMSRFWTGDLWIWWVVEWLTMVVNKNHFRGMYVS